MSKNDILAKVIPLFSEMTTVEEINEDSELMEDLEISSMDVLMLICKLEDEFQINIPEAKIRNMYTVRDVVNTIYELQQ